MRFLRYKTRTLFVVVALIAFPLGWVARQRSYVRADESLVSQLAGRLDVPIPIAQAGPCGYEVERLTNQLPWPNAGIAIRTPITPNWFPGYDWFPDYNHDVRTALFNRVYRIRLGGAAASKNALSFIEHFAELQSLTLDDPVATDSEIGHYARANPGVDVRVGRKR